MRRLNTTLFALTAVACAASAVKADTRPNPYAGIVVRNSFSLKDPPPPPPDTPPAPPPLPLAKVVLTGITSIFGAVPRALLEITEQEQGKAAVVSKPVMKQGEREGSVEILFIDVPGNQVRIRNGTLETNITFEVVKSPATGGPGAPTPLMPNLPQQHAAAGVPITPTIISPNGINSASRPGSGVSFYGGASPTPSTPSYGMNSASIPSPTGTSPNQGYVSTYGAGGPAGASGLTRPLRTDPQAPMTAQEQIKRMAEQHNLANQRGIQMPPPPPGLPGVPTMPTIPNVQK